ncbi:hypothetical protein BH11ARM1_BH11ARM1_02210 [soil metagenome]
MVEAQDRIPDGLLLLRYRNGDEAAFSELRTRYERLVYSTCRRETGDATLAEDASQGVFLLLIRKSFPEQASLAGWLHGASRLVSKNILRAERRRKQREINTVVETTGLEEAWHAVEPLVDAAISSLKPDDREALLLRFVSELSLAEIGSALRVSENTARMRVARALEKTRAKLKLSGVAISAIVLSSLLSTRFAEAASPTIASSSMKLASKRSIRAASGASMIAIFIPWTLAAVTFIAVVTGGLIYADNRPKRLSSTETNVMFSSLASQDWVGTLEFADDRTGIHTKTPVKVVIDRPNDGLRMVATYPEFKNVDTTTFVPLPSGKFLINNGGPGSSHRLDGEYDLIRLSDGSAAFLGNSFAVSAPVRLQVIIQPHSVSISEDVKRGDVFTFRNRFVLHHGP